MNKRLELKTDSYKVSHWKQFPNNIENTYYYIESRGGVEELKFFGLQAIIKKILSNVPTKEQIEFANKFWSAHGEPFNKDGWMKIVDLGYYPLKIKSVKEGSLCKPHQPLVTIENTNPELFWLPGWIETTLLQVWYPITVCTKSYQCKKVILDFLEKTGDPESVLFKLHDFGYRGVSSQESAEMGGMSHLVNFMGTDTIAGVLAAQEYYNTDEMVAFSIPAAEHSTMTAWGKENESDAYKNMLDKFAKPESLVAVVSDSYDLEYAVENYWGGELKQQVIDSGATIVIRPDSGEPWKIVLRTVKQLDRLFGSTINDKKYKVLNPAVRVIQGDGIDNADSIYKILDKLTKAGYSADNVAFGMGGGLLQQVNRDNLKFAMKCSAVKQNGEWKDVFKCPVDAPWKASKGGRFDDDPNLELVWENGRFIKEYTFMEVRDNENS